jgi:large subunit ribosomal protein L18
MKILPKKRRMEGKTNYVKRKKLLENSKARIVIRKTNKYILLQFVESSAAQDKVKLTVISKELLEHGWPKEKSGSLKNLGASYLTGVLFGKKAKKFEKIGKIALDTGLIASTKGSRLYAAIRGMIDSGMALRCKEEMFPSKERMEKDEFFKKIKDNLIKN